jgi:AcrR family transcriptional regulator
MGVKERKDREKLIMKKHILDTAKKIFTEKGLAETSIRNIASEIEYSPATIYLYFTDKNEILFHLQETAYENFMGKINEFSFMKDHFSRLKKKSVSYVEFAVKNPSSYELLFYDNPYSKNKAEAVPPRNKILAMLKEDITTTIANNQLSRMPVNEAVSLVWSFLHGLSNLAMTGQISYISGDEFSDHLNSLVNRFFNHLKSGY